MDRVRTTDAFSLLELNFKHAVASVLNKPQWWTQWRDPTARGQWLAERRTELLRKTYDECLLWKQKDSMIVPTLDSLVELVQEPYSAQKEARVHEWRRTVRCGIIDAEGKYTQELSETPREKDSMTKSASTRSNGGRFVFCEELTTRSRMMNAYLYVQWYFTMTILQEKLTAIPV